MAELFCRKGIEIAPDSAEVQEFYGEILMKMGAWQRAIEAFGRCLRVNPQSSNARFKQQTALRYLADPPAGALPERQAGDYLALAKKYDQDHQDFLAQAAHEAAKMFRPRK